MHVKFLEGEASTVTSELQEVFDEAVQAAREISQNAGECFFEITEVRFYTAEEEKEEVKGKWIWDDATKTACVAISRSAEPEALTHEVGHSFFHPSPLHHRHNERDQYGDKFCNAFRFFMHPNRGNAWMPSDGGQYDAHARVAKCSDMEGFKFYFGSLCKKKREAIGTRLLDLEGI